MADSERGADRLSSSADAIARIRERLLRNPPKTVEADVGPSPTEVEGRLRRAGIDRLLLTADKAQINQPVRRQLGAWLTKAEHRLTKGQGLYMWGPVGTGKSMAAVAVVRELARLTDSIRWYATSDLMLELENPYQRNDLIRRVSNVRLLVLDDFGTQVLTAKYSEWLDQIADARYRRQRSTIATSNVQPSLLGLPRLIDRWRASMVEVEFTGKSRREHGEL